MRTGWRSSGRTLPGVAAPVAAYVPAVRSGDLRVHLRPAADGRRLARRHRQGRRRGRRPRTPRQLAATCALNALAAVKSEIGDLDRVRRVVKVVGFVASAPDFTGQPGVVNGASELLGEVFGDKGVHARSAVGVAVLPLDAPVEVELVVEVD